MQLTQSNYLQHREHIDWSRMPAALTDKPKTVTDNAAAKGWTDMGEQTQKATEQFFKLCNMLIVKDPSLLKSEAATSTPETHAPAPKPAPKKAKPRQSATGKEKTAKPLGSKLIIDLPAGIPQPSQVPLIATHTAFIKRYVTMHGKVKTRDQIVALLHGLQKAITEQRVRSSGPAMREIQKMQGELITLAEKMTDPVKIEINEPYLSHYKQVAQGEEVRTSVKLLKQFIQVNGKSPDKAKVEKLGKKLAATYDSIPKEDIYRNELAAGAKAVADYVSGAKKTVGIPEAALHGLGGIAAGHSVSGLGIVPGSGDGAIIRLLREEGAKNLSDATLKKAFRKTLVPSLCLEIARSLIHRGELTMDVLNNAPSKKSPAGWQA